jgi:tetratricopeptide (TPR) repeat protein
MIPLAVYLATLADGVYWEDSALLTAASLSLGIAHSPGHPLYVLLGKAASLLGVASPPQLVNGLSAFAGAAACLALWLFLVRLVRASGGVRAGTPSTAAGVALIPALSLAFAQPFWRQAVVAEVYTLHAALVLLALACLMGPRKESIVGWWLLGLACANHLTAALVLPVAVWLTRGRRPLPRVAALIGGLSLYLYLPVRSRLDPLVDWGDPETLDRLRWMLSASEFSADFFSGRLVAWGSVLGGMQHSIGVLLLSITPAGAALGLAGLTWLLLRRSSVAAVPLAVLVLTGVFALLGGGGPDEEAYFLLPSAMVATFAGFGLLWLTTRLRVLWVACGLIPVALFALNLSACRLRGAVRAEDYARRLATQLDGNSVLLADNSVDYFLLLYLNSRGGGPHNVIYLPHLRHGWARRAVARSLDIPIVPSDGAALARLLSDSGFPTYYAPRGDLRSALSGWVPSGMLFTPGAIDSAALAHHDRQVALIFPPPDLVRTDVRAARRWSFVCARLGEYFHHEGDCDRAAAAWERALAYTPDNHALLMNTALCQPPAQAAETLRRVVAMAPDLCAARVRLAKLLLGMGLVEEALREVEAIADDAELLYTKAVILLSAGEVRRARRAAEQLERVEPRGVRALALQAGSWGAEGRWEKAVELYRECLRRQPGHAGIRESLETALRKLEGQP